MWMAMIRKKALLDASASNPAYRNNGLTSIRITTPEFKLDVLNFMNVPGASPYEAVAVFNIPSKSHRKQVEERG